MLKGIGYELELSIYTDASAAKGIAGRRGLGKVRQLEVSQLWLQDKVARGQIHTKKVNTHDNWADALTKPMEGHSVQKHLEMSNQIAESGRHILAPEIEHSGEHARIADSDEDVMDEEVLPAKHAKNQFCLFMLARRTVSYTHLTLPTKRIV